MEQLVIEGGHSLKGAIRISGAKNAALPVLAATLLTPGKFTITNLPDLRDIRTFLNLLAGLGINVSSFLKEDPEKDRGVLLDTTTISNHEAAYDLVRTMRASVLILGPLLARTGTARISLPGGCAIGARPIDFHLKGLERMGARLTLKAGYVEAKASRLTGTEIYFDVPSVTGTENLMMAASLARGKTLLKNAAREPEVVTLGQMLQAMGAKITGLGSSVIEIEGVKELKAIEWRIIPDRIETGTYLMAVAAAGGELRLQNACPEYLEAVIAKLREIGMEIEQKDQILWVRRKRRLKSADVTTMPYPGFPTDLQAQFMLLMATADGLSVITETIFENRFMHVPELNRLGADIRIEGKSAIVRGVKELIGAPVMATDLRASACLVLAGLAARGKTTVSRIYHLDRGYEHMEKKLAGVQARIERIRTEMPY
ncbi:MAG: UDP-N-acetylglucosamine 1-carboxyvinyltransferase [Dissulfuribacterales bacterium]